MPAWDLRASIESTVLAKARQYGCEIGLAFHGEIAGVPHETAVFSDGVCDSTQWAWGCVTKQFTGALLLQRVEQRRFESLDSVAHRYVDPQLSKLGLGSMATLFGLDAERITLRHLATMASGVPDYDTAKPDTPIPTDVFRAECYEAPGEVFGPAQILNLSWVARGRLRRVRRRRTPPCPWRLWT
jgi:CubicO group peptidase (beta-lactamase class C family)